MQRKKYPNQDFCEPSAHIYHTGAVKCSSVVRMKVHYNTVQLHDEMQNKVVQFGTDARVAIRHGENV